MTAAVVGPYEHTGQYVGSELFDTTGTTLSFCSDCEHDPCIAGARSYCRHRPRFIVTAAIVREIRSARFPWSPWELPFRLAVSDLLQVAAGTDWRSQSAMATLAEIRAYVRDELAKAES